MAGSSDNVSAGKKPLILVIGTLAEYVSGTSVSLSVLLELLRERDDIELEIINTHIRSKGLLGPIERTLRVLLQVFVKARRADVVAFHINEPQKGIPIWLLAKLWRKPFLLRWFGGVDYRTHGSRMRKASARFLIKHADLNLVQTKWLVKMSQEDGSKRTVWYPTSRLPQALPEGRDSGRCRRFIFAGQVKPSKGIFELINAAERMDETVEVHVYGNFFDGMTEEDFKGLKRVNYCGTAPHDKMISLMSQYDALVLPTYFHGEGYPGVVIEAFHAGIPVICTNWMSIPEIVDDTSGILIPARDTDSLYDAMKRLVKDESLYARLREGASSKSKSFSAHLWADRFAELCVAMANGRLDSVLSGEMEKPRER